MHRISVSFFRKNEVPDSELKFAVIAAKQGDKWVFCKHKERTTWEIPGGHRETGETIEETAGRELAEETGAIDFHIVPLAVYCVETNEKTYGMLFFADITKRGELSADSEIGEIGLVDSLPNELTYPQIQPSLFSYAAEKATQR